jgi:hypothetical protein
VRLALTGILYARYLDPTDALVSDDPLFLRKHQFIPLNSGDKQIRPFIVPELKKWNSGSFLIGGFADFSVTAGKVSSVVLRRIDVSTIAVGSALLSSLRDTRWQSLDDADLHYVGLRIRSAREWIVQAAFDETVKKEISLAMIGILSPGRRTSFLSALETHDWKELWRQVTIGDLFLLGDPELIKTRDGAVDSPTIKALLKFNVTAEAVHLQGLGQNLRPLLYCSHPHLSKLPPYEYYEAELFPSRLAARSSEYKLYLAEYFDRAGFPAALLSAVAEPLAIELLNKMHPSDTSDWKTVTDEFAGINVQMVEKILKAK